MLIDTSKNSIKFNAAVVFSVLMFLPLTTFASNGIFSGYFRGTEKATTLIGDICFASGNTPLLYQKFEGVQASVTGNYGFSDTGQNYDLNAAKRSDMDTQIAFYTSFDPANPNTNLVGLIDSGYTGYEQPIALQAGTNYTVVIQACTTYANRRGEWSFTYRGPGTLSGPAIYAEPAWSSGNFDGSDPTLPEQLFCGLTDYQVSGPVRVPRTGEYRYSDASVYYGVDISLAIYQGNFNSSSPYDNLVDVFDDGGTFNLEAGVDYFLLVQPLCEDATGDFEYVLLGPDEEFQITEGVNGAWVNLDTTGQGILMDIYPDIQLLFAAWFTWDTTQPGQGETAVVGGPNQRWVTAQGTFLDSTANLTIYNSSGGLFDNPTATSLVSIGTMTITFTSCSSADVQYSMSGLVGAFTMNRIANDNILPCKLLADQKKVPFN